MSFTILKVNQMVDFDLSLKMIYYWQNDVKSLVYSDCRLCKQCTTINELKKAIMIMK